MMGKKKKFSLLVLTFCIIIAFTSIFAASSETQAASKTKVTSGIKKSTYTFKVKSNNVMLPDPASFSKNKIVSGGDLNESSDYCGMKYVGEEESYSVLEEYLQLLQETFQLKQVDEYISGKNFGYGFEYTGAAKVNKSIKSLYHSVPCHVQIWGKKKYDDKVEFYLDYSKPLFLGDTGHRSGGKTVSRVPAGKSALSSLYKLSDGSYQTGDGRLTAKVGYATVLRDGKKSSVKATWTLGDSGDDRLWIENYYRNECIYFEAPEHYLMKGDIFQVADLERGKWVVNHKFTKSDFTGYKWGGPFFGLGHGDRYITPLSSTKTEFSSVTVRLMHYDRNKIAVFYIYAKCKTSPHTIEALCAVKPKSAQPKNTITIKQGATKSVSFNGQVYGAGYEVYTWKILEGSQYITLSSEKNSTCKIKGKKKGTAKIQVTYDYNLQEPDVLTGIIRSQPHSKTETFIIKVK